MVYILTYEYVEDYLEKRKPHRKDHFDHVSPYIKSGNLLLGGATANPADKGIIIYKGLTKDQIQDIVKNDPYYKAGIIKHFSIREWTVVVGALWQTD